MTQCRDCGKEYDNVASSERGLCPACMPKWLRSAQAAASDYARQWQQERMRAERLARILRALRGEDAKVLGMCMHGLRPGDLGEGQ